MYGKFLVEGVKNVRELLASSYKVVAIYALREWIDQYGNALANPSILTEVNQPMLEQLAVQKNPNQVIAVAEIPEQKEHIAAPDKLLLALDCINDPGNMGTILRIADWFGVEQILCSNDCVDVYNAKTVQASMGSLFRTRVWFTNLREWLEANKTIPVYGALLKGKSMYETPLKSQGILLIGNEANGISEELLPYIHHPIMIPRYGRAESLNVAMATAILCAEFRRSGV